MNKMHGMYNIKVMLHNDIRVGVVEHN